MTPRFELSDHYQDLIHELSKRLESIRRYDRYISNADRKFRVQEFWKELKSQEERNILRLKELVAGEVLSHCF